MLCSYIAWCSRFGDVAREWDHGIGISLMQGLVGILTNVLV